MLTVLPDLLRDARLHRQSAESAVENAWAVADIAIAARGPAPVAEPARKADQRWVWRYGPGMYSGDHYATETSCKNEHQGAHTNGRAVLFREVLP